MKLNYKGIHARISERDIRIFNDSKNGAFLLIKDGILYIISVSMPKGANLIDDINDDTLYNESMIEMIDSMQNLRGKSLVELAYELLQ